jgi:hypothetical protein
MNKRRAWIIFYTSASVLTGLGLIIQIVFVTVSALRGKMGLFNFNDLEFLRALGIGTGLAGLFAFFSGFKCLLIKAGRPDVTTENKFGLREKVFWTLGWAAMTAIGWLAMKMKNLGMSFFVGWVIMISVSALWIVYELRKQEDGRPKEHRPQG